jgi:lysophospholipase L1-like esterase
MKFSPAHTSLFYSFLFCASLSFGIKAGAQKSNLFLFDFGTGKAAKGYTKVLPSNQFNYQTGFGFTGVAEIVGVDRGGKDLLRGDYCTSTKPFYFSVKVPDGNYDVTVILGDKMEESNTTVRVESRRLMLENIKTTKGNFTNETFTVHIRDSIIRNAKGDSIGKIKLKSRPGVYESDNLHWDNLLTIEFNNLAPKVCGVEIRPNNTAITVFLAGNSTVVDQDKEPWASWGQMIPRFFKPKLISVANYAESGEALNSFWSERRMEKILSLMKKGDYLFIEFAHNDQKQKGPGIGAFTSYKTLLKKYIQAVREKGGIPFLVTSMNRRSFDSTGQIVNTLGDYPAAMRETAAEENLAMIDMNAVSKVLYEAWGPILSTKAFVHYPANSFPGQTVALKDDTHYNTFGAYELAKCIVQALKDQSHPLSKLLLPGLPKFDPAKPDLPENFYWPMSTKVTGTKPDGN